MILDSTLALHIICFKYEQAVARAIDMSFNFLVFWAYHASHRGGGWPVAYAGTGVTNSTFNMQC